MTPDTGAILNLYFDIDASATPGEAIIDTMTVGGKIPRMSTIWGDYWPVFISGKIVIPECAHGDANCDGFVNIADLTYLVDYMFRGGPPPDPRGGDVDGDGSVTVADITYLVDYLFRDGPPPPP